MTEYELGWVVGFLEGEGSFQCLSPPSQKGGSILKVTAGQVQLEPLLRMKEICGGVIYPIKHRKPNAQDSFTWMLRFTAGALLCEKLHPYMSPKRQGQIDAAMAKWNGRRRHNRRANGLKAAATRKARNGKDPRQLRLVG